MAADGKAPAQTPAPPAPDPRWSDEARALQKTEAWPKLEALAQDWSAAQPRSSQALTYLGLAQSARGRYQEALSSLQRAVDIDDHDDFAWGHYAGALRRLGRVSEAEQALQRAIDLRPGVGQYRGLRAEWWRFDGRLAEARREVKEALRLQPGSSAAWRSLGLIEDARGDGDAARRAFQMAVRLGEQDPEVKQRLARKLAAAGKADEAVQVNATERGSAKEIARTYAAIGNAELAHERLGPAEDAFRQALAHDPESATVWNALGAVLQRSKRLPEADEALARAARLDPDNAEFLVNQAIVRLALGRSQEALEQARRATELAPDDRRAWRVYGEILGHQQKYREAADALTRVEAAGKANIDDLVHLANARARSGDPAGAQQALVRAEAIDARHVGMNMTTSYLLGRQGDYAGSLRYAERALQTDPTHLQAWSNKGYALLKLGRLPEAVSALETVVRLGPEFSKGWTNLGEAHLRSKNLREAIIALERAIALVPEAPDTRLYLSQAYLGALLPVKAREHALILIAQNQAQVGALRLVTMSYLLEGNAAEASSAYRKLKVLAPAVASELRSKGIASGLPAAMALPD